MSQTVRATSLRLALKALRSEDALSGLEGHSHEGPLGFFQPIPKVHGQEP